MDLFVSGEGRVDATVISNVFIDEYMKDANDAEVKVYLYLLRMLSAGLSTDISKMADFFNHTERDILRSLKYWSDKGLLSLEYDAKNELSGIKFLPLKRSICSKTDANPAIVPMLITPDEAADSGEGKSPINENITYSREKIKIFTEADETSQIVFVAEQYLMKPLTQSDLQALYFIYDELHFSCEMTDYLLQYCVGKGKKSFSFIKKVAIDWAERGISTPKMAKELTENRYEKYVYQVLNALGRTSSPLPLEAEMVTRWYKEYGFSLELILEACRRTVLATDSHRLEYCDKILLNWKNSGFHTISDVTAQDSLYRAKKTGDNSGKPGFGKFEKTDYDFDALEKMLSK